MLANDDVGALRQQSALCDAGEPIVVRWLSGDRLTYAPLKVIRVYPDTTNGGEFVIEVERDD